MRQIYLILIILGFAVSATAATDDSVFAIVKLSYNTPGETPLTGGISGTAFLVNDKTLITAHHVLNENTKPNSGFKYCEFWLLKRGPKKLTISLKNTSFKYFPDIETTVIKLKQPIADTKAIELKNINHKIGDEVYSIGHIGGKMPIIKAGWSNTVLVIHDYLLKSDFKSDKSGFIVKIAPDTVHMNDVNIDGIIVIKPSFTAIEGMSGGPLINKRDNKLVGLMSFGLPPDRPIKDEVFAISVNEIIRKFSSSNIK